MAIYFDTARDENDVRQAMELYIADLNLTEELFTAQEIEHEFRHWLGLYHSTPEGFLVARDHDRVVGVAAVVLRPPQWMLTNFFVDPHYHGQGIGRELLNRVLAIRQNVTRFCLHASTHAHAQMLYLKAGLYPRPHSTWLQLEVERIQKLEIPRSPDMNSIKVALNDIIEPINAWDRQLLCFEREVDHRWWSAYSDYYLLEKNGTKVGYFKVTNDGHIGPLVVEQPEFMADALDLAILASKQTVKSSRQRVLIPGDNNIAIERLLHYGYRFAGAELLLSSHSMPNLSRTIFHDTDLL